MTGPSIPREPMLEHTIRNRMWIGNEWSDAEDGGTFETVNPATGETITEIASAQAADVDRAVQAARGAMENPEWRDMNPHKRSKLLWKLADAIQAASDELATLETMDNGKPYFESRKVDMPSIVENYRYFAGMADKVQGGTIPVAGPFFNYTLREPVGVVGCITPWNFVLSGIFPALMTLSTVFRKFSAPPLFHRNCCERAALMTPGSSAGVSTFSRYLNFQFLSCAR